MPKKTVKIGIGALAAFAVIQVVPYGRAHDNPPSSGEPSWDRPETRALAARACFDCHGNQTVWPWYSHVAPVSWLVQRDVDAGRRHLNFHEWQRPQKHAKDAAEEVGEGEMPLKIYVLMHPEARLDDAERKALVDGLARTVGHGAAAGHDEHHEHHD